jgi:capsular exopolysaccharide synthesis family protein
MIAVLVAAKAIPTKDPELTAKALIGIEKREDMAAGMGASKENLGREDLMLGRTFLKEIVRSLSLQLVTGKKRRSTYFDPAVLDSIVQPGRYRVRVNRLSKTFSIRYFDTNALSIPLFGPAPFVKGQPVVGEQQITEKPVVVPGMVLLFSKGFIANPHSFDFSVINIRLAVENVLRSLTIKRADPEHGINYISVQITGSDYELIAATANEIARVFVEKNISFSKRRSQSILDALEKQLALANGDQGVTSTALSSYQSENPRLGLSAQAEQAAANLAQVEANIQSTQRLLDEAAGLGETFSGAHGDERERTAAAMLETMAQNNFAAARPLRDALQQLIAEEQSYAANYDERHPLRLENSRKIDQAIRDAAALFNTFIQNLRNAIASHTATKNAISQELNRLPTQAMQLGKLQRKQEVTSQVYTAVLERYNQAKVVDAVEMADFYIMDAAVPPLPPPQDKSSALIVAVLIGLAVPVGFLVIRDRWKGAVYTKSALADLLGAPVLEAVPKFTNRTPGPGGNVGPRIDWPCEPPFIPELFDGMFMRLSLRWGEHAKTNVVAVTGLETGGGKSTIAVNLALKMAELGNSVLLVDSDMHRGRIHDQFNVQLSPGLMEMLAAPDEAILHGPFSLIIETGVPGLSVIAAGETMNNSFAALSSSRFAEYIGEWRKRFTYVVIDAAPIGVIPDAAAFCATVDSYIVVVNAGSTNIRALEDRLNEFPQISAKIAGFVLNRADAKEALLYHRSYSRYHRKREA